MSSYKCSKCEYVSGTKGLIKKHIDNVSKCEGAKLIENIVRVSCDICNKQFDTEKLLLVHKKKCFEKKVMVKDNFIDSEEMNDKIVQLMKFCKKLADENVAIREEVILLKSKFDLMEKNPMSKKEVENFEDLGEEEEDDALCEYGKLVEFIPLSYENTVYNLKDCNCEDFDVVNITIKGQRDYIVKGSVERTCIVIGDVDYLYQPSSGKKLRGKKYTDDLKIKISKYCYNRKLKGKCYCLEHATKIVSV